MVCWSLLLLVFPLSVAVPQREDQDRDPPVQVTTGGTPAPPESTTIMVETTTTVSPPPKPTATGKGIPLPVEVDCSDPSWSPSVDAWMKEEVDRKLKEWWQSTPNRTRRNFVAEFGKAFGDSEHNLACGVDTEDQCVNPSCKGLFYTLFLSLILCYFF